MLRHMARSSSGSGRRPLKAEITGSNPVRATKSYPRVFEPGVFFYMYASPGGHLSSRCRPPRLVLSNCLWYSAV